MQLDRTREIINQLSSRGKAPIDTKGSKAVMVILTGTSTAIEDWIKPLIRARGQGIRYELVLSKAAGEMLDLNKLTLKLQPRRVIVEGSTIDETLCLDKLDAIVAPLLSQNTAFKLLNGIQDQIIPRLLWEGLWIGKPIWLNLQGLRSYRGREAANGAMKRLVEENIQRIISMGIKEINPEDYMQEIISTLALKKEEKSENKQELGLYTATEAPKANSLHSVGPSSYNNRSLNTTSSHNSSRSSSHYSSISSSLNPSLSMGLWQGLSQREATNDNSNAHSNKKSIITEGDILRTPNEIKEIKVSSNSIITPLAYDTAKRRGIKIIKA